MNTLSSVLLNRYDWVQHGFGTRAGPLSQAGMVSVKQVHSNRVLAAGANPTEGPIGEADALITNQVTLTISIRTADCLPILLLDPNTRAVAAIHAGWRGSAAGIVAQTIARMRAEYGTDVRNLVAAIGPGIGKCCYEVSEDVAVRFGEKVGPSGKLRLDLAEENRRQLLTGGVEAANIEVLPYCTFCDPVRFHSFRRDVEQAGRMITFIVLS